MPSLYPCARVSSTVKLVNSIRFQTLRVCGVLCISSTVWREIHGVIPKDVGMKIRCKQATYWRQFFSSLFHLPRLYCISWFSTPARCDGRVSADDRDSSQSSPALAWVNSTTDWINPRKLDSLSSYLSCSSGESRGPHASTFKKVKSRPLVALR
jgi:hypothetical protein